MQGDIKKYGKIITSGPNSGGMLYDWYKKSGGLLVIWVNLPPGPSLKTSFIDFEKE
jgi:hypothetical protein